MQVHLPKNAVPQKLSREALSKYRELIKNRVQTLHESADKGEYLLQDGAPYANGEFHIGHFLNKSLKDFYLKYKLQDGYKVDFKFGWDCHGLPIENKAKDMDGDLLENSKNIALKYRKIQKETLHHFGIFSTGEDYLTLDEDYIDRELSAFNVLKANGSIFEKYKPTWYSPKLKCVLANSEIEYKNISENSVYFCMPTKHNYKFVVWTTTEWTIAGNQAIALSEEIDYVLAENGLICSRKFADNNQWCYSPISHDKIKSFETYTNINGEVCPILFESFVTDDKTGIVHLCGGHGDEDFDALNRNNISPKNVVSLEDIEFHLNDYKIPQEYLLKYEQVEHSVPVDWREKERVIKVLTLQTYLNFDWSKIKSACKQIKMSSKDRSRLESMLFSRKD